MPLVPVDSATDAGPGRLKTPLLPDEVLVQAGDIRIDGAQGSVAVRAGTSVVELGGVERSAIAEILKAVDGKATVREISAVATRGLDRAAVRSVLHALVGFCIWIAPRADARPCRSLIVVDNFLPDAD